MQKHPQAPFPYEQASAKLVEFFPELQDTYGQELIWWGSETPGPHVIYEDVFWPHIERSLASNDDNTLQRVFIFLELLSAGDDVRLHDLVAVSICQHLVADSMKLNLAHRYMGPAMLILLRRVEKSDL